jgi:hypothetical protein
LRNALALCKQRIDQLNKEVAWLAEDRKKLKEEQISGGKDDR